MKRANWAWFLVAGATLLAGCKDFWQAPTSTTTTTTTTTLSSGYFYVLDAATSEVIAYDIVSGALTKVGAYPVPSPPIAIAVAPDKDFLYVSTLNGIFLYTIGSGGALTQGNNTIDIAADPATAMAIDSTSSWLIEASGQTGYLYAVPVNPTTGLLASSTAVVQQAPLKGETINQIAISPNNDYVFVAAGSNGTYAYGFTAGNGDPFGSAAYDSIPVENSSAGSSLSVAVDPSNRLLYVGEVDAKSSGGGLRAFTISSSGALAELSGSPYASGGTGPYSILPKSTNDTVYVANWEGTSSGNITGFSISYNNSVYGLTQLANAAATGVRPSAIAEDSNENFVLAESAGGSPYFSAYVFDKTTPTQLDLTITDSTYVGATLAAQHY